MDTLAAHTGRQIAKYMQQDVAGCWGVIKTYNAATHKATATVEPDSRLTNELPMLVPALGWNAPIAPGQQCFVLYDHGAPSAIAGVTYAGVDQVPSAGLTFQGDLHIGGNVTAMGAFTVGQVAALPTASAALRGAMYLLAPTALGATGTADTLHICIQQADGSAAWKTVTLT